MHKGKKRPRLFATAPGRIAFSIIVTAVVGFLYFYVSLPAINLQDGSFYTFLVVLGAVYIISAYLASGPDKDKEQEKPAEKASNDGQPESPFHELLNKTGKVRGGVRFVRRHCLPVGILLAAVLLVAAVGRSSPCPSSAPRPTGSCWTCRPATLPRTWPRSPSTRYPPWIGPAPTSWATARWAPSATW